MPGIGSEFAVFIHAVLDGIFSYAVYASIVVIRKLIPHKRLAVQLEDFCYWVFLAGYLFVQVYHTNSGKIRWYSVLGVVFGALFLWKILGILQKMVEKYVHRQKEKSRKILDKKGKKR